MNIKYIIATIFLTILYSCNKDTETKPQDNYFQKGGIFIVNEGNYSSANASITYYNPTTDSVFENIFYIANNAPLGDVAQSIVVHNDIAYITINNSGHIYAINCKDASFAGKIEGLISPRNMLIINDKKAYVSDLYSPDLVIVNPQSYEKTGHIEIGKSTEAMVASDSRVYVSNWSNYNQSASNNTVMVIDSETDELIDSLVVGIEPESLVIDKDNFLWVLCSGGFMNDENPTLWKVNINTGNIEIKFTFDDILSNPTNLLISEAGDMLYFLNNGVYSMSVSSSELPSHPMIESNDNNYYSFSINSNGDIYVSDALDYTRNGKIFRFNSNGQLITSFNAGIIPGSFGFYK